MAELLPSAVASQALRRDDALPAQHRLPPVAQVADVYTRLELAHGQLLPSDWGRLLAHSYAEHGNWFVMLVLGGYQMEDIHSWGGTTHFSPWSYDRHVPLAFYGEPFVPGEYHERVAPVDLAATLASLAGVNQPSAAVGRVLTMASNTSWLWAREAGASSLFYRRFWRQAVRAVCGQTEGGRVLQVSWNKTSFRPGDRIVGTVRTPGVSDVRLRATVTSADGGMRPLTAAGPDNGVWQVEWLLESRGVWTIQLTAERNGETLEVYRKTLAVSPLPDEGIRLARQDAELTRLAARCHGAYVPEEQAETLGAQLASYLRPVSRVENRSLVSDGPWFLLLVVLTVLAELALRRRLNLL